MIPEYIAEYNIVDQDLKVLTYNEKSVQKTVKLQVAYFERLPDTEVGSELAIKNVPLKGFHSPVVAGSVAYLRHPTKDYYISVSASKLASWLVQLGALEEIPFIARRNDRATSVYWDVFDTVKDTRVESSASLEVKAINLLKGVDSQSFGFIEDIGEGKLIWLRPRFRDPLEVPSILEDCKTSAEIRESTSLRTSELNPDTFDFIKSVCGLARNWANKNLNTERLIASELHRCPNNREVLTLWNWLCEGGYALHSITGEPTPAEPHTIGASKNYLFETKKLLETSAVVSPFSFMEGNSWALPGVSRLECVVKSSSHPAQLLSKSVLVRSHYVVSTKTADDFAFRLTLEPYDIAGSSIFVHKPSVSGVVVRRKNSSLILESKNFELLKQAFYAVLVENVSFLASAVGLKTSPDYAEASLCVHGQLVMGTRLSPTLTLPEGFEE